MTQNKEIAVDSRRGSVISQLASKATGFTHVELTDNSELDALDSIELTQTGKFAWLVAITAGVGGLLFGKNSLPRGPPLKHRLTPNVQAMTPESSQPSSSTSMMIWAIRSAADKRSSSLQSRLVAPSSVPSGPVSLPTNTAARSPSTSAASSSSSAPSCKLLPSHLPR